MRLSLAEISEIFPSNTGTKAATIFINEIVTDSRKKADKGLFIPIVGDKFDGHDFLKDAIDNGAIAALWQENKEKPAFVPNDFPLFLVKDTTSGLQTLAKHYLQKIKPIVIGITGSNGKTTTKDLVFSVLQKKYKTYKTQGNFNNHIGLPLTILAMPEETEVLILEMGMNHFGEISLLSRIAEPHFAIITNIGESHIEFLGNREGIAKAKLEMIDGLRPDGKLIVDGDEPLLKDNGKGISIIRSGFESHNDVVIDNVKFENERHFFTINENEYELPLLGRHNVKNASYAITVGLQLDVSIKQIQAGLSEIELTGMRLERSIGKNNALIINDAYNSSPTSMKAAIETIKDFQEYDKKVLVLGDMYELGRDEEALHRSVAAAIAAPITDLITIGEKGKWISDEAKERGTPVHIFSFLRKEEALPFIMELLSKDTVILFKASRGAKLESLVNELKV
ncbi:MAG TPA: UDP-N-acetylmuramoyl-tripeptide--D-alanyl-D-alanine ligase [Bacillus bacterium]|nr:UDP-N-acetylmuramoyl-tripeptide--D-alanyl-D-alanine ligase [Bacillus sp. (in: firmicutes)]